jgi:hypothetical protein
MIFQPTLPTITVDLVTEKNLPEILRLIHHHTHFFPQMEEFFRPELAQIRDNRIIVVNNLFPNEDIVIVSVGDYYVTSENGIRYFTDNPQIRHGIFTMLPAQMFTPFYGEKINQ